MSAADIGVIGLAVMGQNLVLNIEDHHFSVSVFNRTFETTERFLSGSAKGKSIQGHETIDSFVASLSKPRKILLMVKAGDAVDKTIETLLPHLDQGDIIIDGGNSHFPDSNRRFNDLEAKGFQFIGAGISGGEEGARFGPSIMPGGNEKAWPELKPIFQAISAKVDEQPCCEWVGPQGSGHFVKMVHNGIEYGDMQLIAEAFDILHRGLGLDCDEISEVFSQWNHGILDSYLVEITADILKTKDSDGSPLVLKILDKAGQKGTGKWTSHHALDEGTALTLISEAVFARALSFIKQQRQSASTFYEKQTQKINAEDQSVLIDAVRDALYASKIISYTQGFMLMHDAANTTGWKLNFGNVAMMWRGGCIIRSRFLGDIKKAFDKNPQLENLLMDDFFKSEILKAENGWRLALVEAIKSGIPCPAMSSALAFFDGFCSETLPANLIQAQRDYFGAHTYERTDGKEGEFHHTDWTGLNGSATSGSYNA